MGATKNKTKKNATDYIDQSTNKKKMKSADVSLQTAKNQRHDKEAKSADVSLQTAKNQRRDKEKMVGWSI